MDFAKKLLSWYQVNGRHDLPWQIRNSPYPVWISEIMLQQTQVKTVIPYFQRFIEQFPDIITLADASLDEVLNLWTGLGYYSRARNLHKAANIIKADYNGLFPKSFEDLVKLPGIGKSTAGAILAQSFGQRLPILDGNVRRVLSRYRMVSGWPGQGETDRELWNLSEKLLPYESIEDYTQAIMDLGATVCTRNKPHCKACPVNKDCRAYANGVAGEYPQKRPRKTLPVKKATYLLAKNTKDEIYLIQRPPAGIWGGLWCSPEAAFNDRQELEWAGNTLTMEDNHQQLEIRHTFSHFHLDITVIPARLSRDQAERIMESDRGVWYNPDNPLKLGLAAPIKKLIHTTEVPNGKNG